MTSDEARCAEAARHRRITDAFRRGDLDALRAAVDDPSLIPNGRMPPTVGTCLVYAIYHSPRAFIRQLLELGADPVAPADDGFPPLLAALSCSNSAPGAPRREDTCEIVRLLLSFGADPDQRGINDWAALHMAVAERNALAVQLLLDKSADPDLRTRIDECETALEMARAADLRDIAAILERRGAPLGKRMRSGLRLLLDVPGTGALLQRREECTMRLRLWLNHGDAVKWDSTWKGGGVSVEDAGETLVTRMRYERRSLVNGLFYGIEGMRLGGTRRLEIAPHLAYGTDGLPGRIPHDAVLTAEVTILEGTELYLPPRSFAS